jgi:hypothetical protein
MLFGTLMYFLGDRNTFLVLSSLPLPASFHMHITANLLTQHTLAERSWHFEESSLRFFYLHLFPIQIIHIKIYFVNVASITTGTSTATCTLVTERLALFKHFQSETVEKITCIFCYIFKYNIMRKI